MTLNIEEEINQRIAAMEAEPQASSGVEHVQREILFINDVIHTTGAEARRSVRSLPQIEVYGHATPSSNVRRGIIRFRPPEELRPPYFKEGDQTIRLWLDVAHISHVTTQLLHRKRFLWIGLWPDGYTYADLHSRP